MSIRSLFVGLQYYNPTKRVGYNNLVVFGLIGPVPEPTIYRTRGGLANHYSTNVVKFIRVITKLPNSEQSYKGKVKTHRYINR
jgi:hypothetical protein